MPKRTTKARVSARKAKPASRARRKSEPADLLIRGLSPEVLEVLRSRAEASGRSLQQELHVALRRDTRRNFHEAVAISESWHDRLKGRDLPSTAELLDEDRRR